MQAGNAELYVAETERLVAEAAAKLLELRRLASHALDYAEQVGNGDAVKRASLLVGRLDSARAALAER